MSYSYKRLFIWVEGLDDEQFVRKILIPQLQEKYNEIRIIEYATKKLEWRKNFLKNIGKMKADYIFLADLNSSPCITARKNKIREEIKGIDENKIIIVEKEIESWYLAGLSEESFKQLGIGGFYQKFPKTNNLTKEDFDGKILQASNFSLSIDFMGEIIKYFQLEIVEIDKRNDSLEYFIQKYLKNSE